MIVLEAYTAHPKDESKEACQGIRNETKKIIKQAHQAHVLMGTIHSHCGTQLYGRQTMAFKAMKTLISSERKKIWLNMIEESNWRNHYKKLYLTAQ